LPKRPATAKRIGGKRGVYHEDVVPLKEAKEQVGIALTRAALLHLAFSRTLVDEFGEERGKELVVRAIMEYGRRVGERVKRGLPDLPKYGMIGREELGRGMEKSYEDYKAYDCVFARTFKEYGELDLGSLYCYVDAAKSMAADPSQKLIHRDCASCGDDYCTFEVLPTTEQERMDFAGKRSEWKLVDLRLAEGLRRKSSIRETGA
jgi:predicted hydrocarbon binding protein